MPRNLTVLGATVCLAAFIVSSIEAGGDRVRTYSTARTIPLRTGLLDPLFSGAQRDSAFARSRAAGASYVRLTVPWREIAPKTPPPGFVASDPTSPGYSWSGFDAIVDSAVTARLTPILDVVDTPTWAYASEPKGVNEGTPDISALGDFAKALATHYDGRVPGVPSVGVYEVWNEPNLSLDVSPVSASTYRDMVNAVAAPVHDVDPANLVVAGDLAPYSHAKTKNHKWYVTAPLVFMRSLLCVSKGSHPHSTCHAPIHFDIWSHHPYTPYIHGGPFAHAKVPGDVELGDLPKMRAVLKDGVRLGHVVSARPVQFWVTEFGWNTKPPRKHSAPLGLAARWTAESLHQMWLSGVSLVTWFLLEDLPSPSYYKSGLFFQATSVDQARPKPTLTAFRFPFVAYRHGSRVSVWGRDATSDQRLVTVQRRHGKKGRWRTVARVRSNGNGIFKATLKLKSSKRDWLRAIAGGSGTSLAFSLARET